MAVQVIEISDITGNESNRVQVLVTATERKVWLPRDQAEFGHRCVAIPTWLYRQLSHYLAP